MKEISLKAKHGFFSEGNKGQVTGNFVQGVKVIWVETAVLMPIFDQDLIDRCHFQELGNGSTKKVMIFRPKQGPRKAGWFPSYGSHTWKKRP